MNAEKKKFRLYMIAFPVNIDYTFNFSRVKNSATAILVYYIPFISCNKLSISRIIA